MKKYFILILILISVLFCGCAGCVSCQKALPEEYEINFIIDGEHYKSDTIVFGKKISKPDIDDRDNYVFKGWYITDDYIEQWNFEKPVYSSITLYAYWVATENETFNVTYTGDGIDTNTVKIDKGSSVEKYVPDRKGYNFVNWTYNGQPYNFSAPVYSDITLTAVWEAIKYKVTFTADDEIVAEEYFTTENLKVNLPEIPEKEHYTAKWTNFVYELKDIEMTAIYTPINYTATFYVDDEIYLKLNYTVKDKIVIPEVPEIEGYTGAWDGLPVLGDNLSINAEYTPIDYTIYYKISDKVLDTRTYNVENKDVTPPDIPKVPGYEGFWEDVELNIGDKTVNGFYCIKELYACFVVDNEVVATIPFTVEDVDIDVPTIPDKEGYTASWEDFTLGAQDITIKAEYRLAEYTASFMINNQLIESIKFTVEDTTLQEPEIPEQYQKTGYTARWAEYAITASDIEIGIEYLIDTYYASFKYPDGEVIKIAYTIDDKIITEPAPPEIDGYITMWEDYTLTYEDIEINLLKIERVQSVTIGNLKFSLSDDDTYSLIEYLVEENMPLGNPELKVEIPSKVNYLPVTAIASQVFAYKTNFDEIVLPDSISEIGEHAFSYTNIKSIKLPESLTQIKNIFVSCPNLVNVYIPESVKFIDATAFHGCASLNSAEFENSDNWHIYQDSEYKKEIIDSTTRKFSEYLADPNTAAMYLKEAYVARYWKRDTETL